MRKILKTAASLVLCCALLSVSAFAAPESPDFPQTRDDIADVNIRGLEDNDQSTILVVKGDFQSIPANLNGTTQILYIDQLPEEGQMAEYTINFGDYIGVATVFAGSSSSDTAIRLGTITNVRKSMFVKACTTEGDDSTAIETATLSAVGDTQQLYAVLFPAESNDRVEWSAEGAVSVEVDEETGVATVTALEEGTGTVTLTADNEGLEDEEEDLITTTVTYTVGEVATGAESITIKLDGEDVTEAHVNELNTIQFTAEVTGTAASDVVWTIEEATDSDYMGAADVDEAGLVTPVTDAESGIGDVIVKVSVDGKEDTVILKVWRYGDLTGDGYVDGEDALHIQYYDAWEFENSILGENEYDETQWIWLAADVTGDEFGVPDQLVDGADALQIQYYDAWEFENSCIPDLLPYDVE